MLNQDQASVKRMFWDIETSPNLGFFWRAGYDIDVNHDGIVKERKIITIAWKWEGERQVHFLCWDKFQDDKAMLKAFMQEAEKADEMVAHYGDRFDLPWFRTRCLIHHLTPLPAYKTVDTKAWASKYFYFNSNKLDYLGHILGHGRKLSTQYDLWMRIVWKNDPRALAYMVKYNKQDVVLLEKVWNDLRFCVAPKSHAGVVAGKPKWTCGHCGSENVKKSKTKVSSTGTKKHQMICHDCQSYYTISATDFQAYLAPEKETKRPAPTCRASRVAKS